MNTLDNCAPKEGCGCSCHRIAGVKHMVPCCDLPPLVYRPATRIVEQVIRETLKESARTPQVRRALTGKRTLRDRLMRRYTSADKAPAGDDRADRTSENST